MKYNHKVTKYIETTCANHAGNGHCLLETTCGGSTICPFFHDVGFRCKYAEQSVLPGNTEVQAIYMQSKGQASVNTSNCKRCNSSYQRKSNRQKYCSDCSSANRRRQTRKYMAAQRSNVSV
ncbi:hypothetical protein BK130_16510 [Viridibacillus sp. FSL H8-0123]|nr:hypothetical protein BK130_16510 [Viridibacillus sp. FSL H8-0123]